MIGRLIHRIRQHWFLFEELIKRDFKKKYKGTTLGIFWSVLSPLLSLFVMKLIFTEFFGRNLPHYTIYLFSGNIVMTYFREATKGGMNSLVTNASIFTKINVPKYMFVFSRNVSSLINFMLTFSVYIFFCILDGITFGWHMLMLIFPICCLLMFNLGMGMTLSALYVFFRDVSHFYEIFLMLLQYASAIFYSIQNYSQQVQRIFLLNPVYVYITYFRTVVIDGVIPSLPYHLLCLFYSTALFLLGGLIYKKNNHKFLYYV